MIFGSSEVSGGSTSCLCHYLQNFHSLATYLSQCTSTAFLDVVSDFHLLLFLVTNEVMPLRVRTTLQSLLASHFPLVSHFCDKRKGYTMVTFFSSLEEVVGVKISLRPSCSFSNSVAHHGDQKQNIFFTFSHVKES